MAMHDWNGDGKKDFGDDYIEYQIYKDIMGEDDDFKPDYRKPTHRKSTNDEVKISTGKLLLIIFGIIAIIVFVKDNLTLLLYAIYFPPTIYLAYTTRVLLSALYKIIHHELLDPCNDELPIAYKVFKKYLILTLIGLAVVGLITLVIFLIVS